MDRKRIWNTKYPHNLRKNKIFSFTGYSIFMKGMQIFAVGLGIFLIGYLFISNLSAHLEIHDGETTKEMAYIEWKKKQQKEEERLGYVHHSKRKKSSSEKSKDPKKR